MTPARAANQETNASPAEAERKKKTAATPPEDAGSTRTPENEPTANAPPTKGRTEERTNTEHPQETNREKGPGTQPAKAADTQAKAQPPSAGDPADR